MNRFRINQILEILLFPYCDTGLQEKDYLMEKCRIYREFLSLDLNDVAVFEKKQNVSSDYHGACVELIHYLADRNEGRIKTYDDVVMLCDCYYPLLEVERLMKKVQQLKESRGNPSDERDNISLFYLRNLCRMAESLLTYRDGVAAIRTWNNRPGKLGQDIFYSNHIFNKVEIWNLLSRFMVPDILIVIFAVDSGLDESALYEQKPNISLADKLLVKCLKKGIAENHMHFNAGFDYERVWLNVTNLDRWYGEKKLVFRSAKEERIFQAALFRFLTAAFLQSEQTGRLLFQEWVRQTQDGAFCRCMMQMYSGINDGKRKQMFPEGFWEAWECGGMRGQMDYLLASLYEPYVEHKTSSEFLLLFHCYRYIKEYTWDTAFSRLFLQYLRIKNEYFRETQQRHLIPGLRYFQQYFNQAKRGEMQAAGKSGMALDVFRSQAKVTCLKKLEIRIASNDGRASPDCFEYEKCRPLIREALENQLFELLYLYRRYILERVLGVRDASQRLNEEDRERYGEGFSYKRLQEDVCRVNPGLREDYSIPTLGIVFHFIKMDSLDNVSGYCCWRNLDETKVRYSNHRLILRQKMTNTARVIEELRAGVPKLNEYIVGIDAASDENAMEPWMFAPAYKVMRSRFNTKPVTAALEISARHYELLQNIGLTYHVGEDFRHIVSGLRHIDEVIEELHYKPGDRLGHALALGIDIEKWIRDHEIVPIPLQEHMENMLWIWGMCVSQEVDLPIQLDVLEAKIMEYAERIYYNHQGITVRMLHQAYKAKFSLSHREILEKLKRAGIGIDESRAVHCRFGDSECGLNQMPWTREKLLSTVYCSVYEEKYNEIILVPIVQKEAEVYREIQEALLKKVEQRGIYVETNPTSNLTIGEFSDFREHPIFRMNSGSGGKEDHHVMVTVNSDDPAVFNTNVENELAYIYYAAEYSGYAKEDILQWLDKIRQNGMDASFIQKEKPIALLLEEVGGMLDWLDPDVAFSMRKRYGRNG